MSDQKTSRITPLEMRYIRIANKTFENSNYRLNPKAEIYLHKLIKFGLKRITLKTPIVSNIKGPSSRNLKNKRIKIHALSQHLAFRFEDSITQISEAVLANHSQTREITSQDISAALKDLCPIWPFCK